MIQLINGECLEEMDKLIAEGVKVDAIITDIPYGTTACKWDSVIPFEPMWERLNKLIKDNGAIVLFGSEPFSSALRMSNIKHYKYDWKWNKNSSGNILCAKYMPLKIIEDIIVFTNKGKCNYYPIMSNGHRDRTHEKPTIKTTDMFSSIKSNAFIHTDKNKRADQRYPKNLINISTQGCECANSKRVHPTQKPVELLEYLIKTYTQENQLVLDFTMGSGSTGVACKHLNRDFIGIELDKGYYDIAVNRIKGASYEN